MGTRTRYDLQAAKELEIVNELKKENLDGKKILAFLKEKGLFEITAPTEKVSEEDSFHAPVMKMMWSSGLRDDYKSVKPGNAVLKIKELFKELHSSIEGIEKFADVTLSIVTVGFIINAIAKIIETLSIDISKEEAYIMHVMWLNCGSDNSIALELAFSKLNYFLDISGEEPINRTKFDKSITFLEKIKAIEVIEEVAYLKEKICWKYS